MLVVSAALAAVYTAAPETTAVQAIRTLSPVIALACVLYGMGHTRSRDRTPSLLLAIGFGSLTCAYLASTAIDTSERGALPSVSDGFHMVSWAALFIALVLMVRRDRHSRDAFGAFEVIIVSIAVGVGVWLLIVEPQISGDDAGMGAIWPAVVPILGGMAFASAVRLAANNGFRDFAPVALMIGVAVQLVADVTRSDAELSEGFMHGGLIGTLGVVGPLVLAAAALDPTIAPENRTPVVHAELGIARTVGLSVAVMAPLTVLLALTISGLGAGLTLALVAAASVVSVVFALARMWVLLDTVQALTERRGQEHLAAMVEHSSDVVVLADQSGHIKYASPGLSGTLGHRSTEWIGRLLLDLIAEEDRSNAALEFRSIFDPDGAGTARFEPNLVRVDGQRRRMEATFVNLIGGDVVDGVVVTFRDITDQRDLERRLSHQAFHDELTGLANRALFLDRVDHALRVARPLTDPVIVLFVDLDDFKDVNDDFGHAAGDKVLRTIAGRLIEVAGAGDTAARLGGDEFALLLEDRGGVDRALEVAEQLLAALNEPIATEEARVAVLASVGVAVAEPGLTTSSLLRDADIAMYEAKRAGKGQIKIFDPAMRLGASTQLEYRNLLGSALENDQLRLVFQPQIDLRTGEVRGAEALVRWTHPTRGDVSPAEFIPVAERSGLMDEIGMWVLHQAMREASRWQHRGPRWVSINVSAVQLRADAFADQVREALELTGLDPRQVVIEITEAVLVEQIEVGSAQLHALRDLGVRLAVDDFGSGECSIAPFQHLPIDVIKIDRRAVAGLTSSSGPASLSRMILHLTAATGVTSLAEGIEEPEQLVALRQLQCDIGQGNLLSVPLEVDELHRRFGTDNASGTQLVTSP